MATNWWRAWEAYPPQRALTEEQNHVSRSERLLMGNIIMAALGTLTGRAKDSPLPLRQVVERAIDQTPAPTPRPEQTWLPTTTTMPQHDLAE